MIYYNNVLKEYVNNVDKEKKKYFYLYGICKDINLKHVKHSFSEREACGRLWIESGDG